MILDTVQTVSELPADTLKAWAAFGAIAAAIWAAMCIRGPRRR